LTNRSFHISARENEEDWKKKVITPRVAASTVVESPDRKRIVLIDREYPPYGFAFPGGMIEIGETVEEAAIRETKEETGLDVEALGLLNEISDPDADPRWHVVVIQHYLVLDGQGKHRFFREGPWRDLIQLFGQKHIAFIQANAETSVSYVFHLTGRGINNEWIAMSDIHRADTACKIQERVSIHIKQLGTFCSFDEDRCCVKGSGRNVLIAFLHQPLRFRAGNGSLQLNELRHKTLAT